MATSSSSSSWREGMSSDNIKGLCLALSSSFFIGAGFIVKKKGLKKAGASGIRAGIVHSSPPSITFLFLLCIQFIFRVCFNFSRDLDVFSFTSLGHEFFNCLKSLKFTLDALLCWPFFFSVISSRRIPQDK
uniref:Uncharacterized protein n=1 Tax=Glycine max TaxID=3847 RepID=C6TK16_SOYBN|nr:unknown [Glycine max]